MGDSTDPCLTPRQMSKELEMCPLTLTLADDVEYQCFSKRHSFPLMPMEKSCFSSMGNSTESKAFSREMVCLHHEHASAVLLALQRLHLHRRCLSDRLSGRSQAHQQLPESVTGGEGE